MNINNLTNNFSTALLISLATRLLGAIVIIIIGFIISNHINKLTKIHMTKRNVDPSLRTFVGQFINIALKVLVILSAATVAGIAVTSFVTILGAISFAIGLAFQGSLSNFAGGVLILIFRPFKVGDYISTGSDAGTVEEIGIVYTSILTVDNKVISLPNGILANAAIINFSKKKSRRVDLVIGVSYDAPIDMTKDIILSVMKNHDLILSDPAPTVRLGALNASSLDYTVRAWVKTENYWDVYFDLHELIKKELDSANIEIPYNKLDVNILSNVSNIDN